jgi:PAS domain S-box-containing protein
MTDHETVAPRPEPSAGQFADLPFLRGEVAFRLLVEAVQDYAIFLLGPDGRVLTWNLGAQRIKGYTADEIIGQHFSRFYTPEEREAGRPMYLLGLAAEYGRFEDEGWRVRKDGTRFWADVILTALRDEDGVPYAYAKVTRDLTERRAAEERERSLLVEREARAAAEQALQVRDRFMSIASHELKTPTATLGLVVQSLLHARTRGTLDDTRLETGLRRIGLAAQRLGTLVDELLDVSRLTSGRLPMDRQSLDQVLSNLLDNAVKYSDATSVIDVDVRREGEGWALSVADRGIGLDAEASSRLFEAFARGLNTEHIPGLGLGLYISHQIVERHGGRISAMARGDGAGSLFSVWLPAAEPPGGGEG